MNFLRNIGRWSFHRSRGFYCILSILTFLLAWGVIEGIWIETRIESLQSEHWKGSSPLTVVHLSDLHTEILFPGILSTAVTRTQEAKPDLIVITGDLFNRNPPEKAGKQLIEALRQLSDSAPVYVCLGNHDYGTFSFSGGAPLPLGKSRSEAIADIVREGGARLLVNTTDTLLIRGETVTLIGLDEYVEDNVSFNRLFNTLPDTPAYRIVLAHSPQIMDEILRYKWNLCLAGHTHGGQIRIPILDWTICNFLGIKQVSRVYPLSDNQHLNVSRGIASLGWIRFFCPPEVVVLKITKN